MVIIIGDARNNKNPSAEEEFKNICRKAKSAYWLNTEERSKWNFQDSIASTYARYARMFQTTTINELMHFVNEDLK